MRTAIRGRQGQTLIIEGVAQATAAGMNPQLGQRRDDLTPDLKRAEADALWSRARGAVAEAFGIPAAFLNPASTGPVFRELERHLVTYTLLPIAKLIEAEATAKLGGAVGIDVERPFQSGTTARGRGACRQSSRPWPRQRRRASTPTRQCGWWAGRMARSKQGKVRSATRVTKLMAIVVLRDFKDGKTPSKFYHEGRFIAELRSSLCLIGWPWPVADKAARDIVSEALRLARAERPGWAEGQRAYVGLDITRDSECRQCGTPLRERQVNFCCGSCRSRWWALFNKEKEAA